MTIASRTRGIAGCAVAGLLSGCSLLFDPSDFSRQDSSVPTEDAAVDDSSLAQVDFDAGPEDAASTGSPAGDAGAQDGGSDAGRGITLLGDDHAGAAPDKVGNYAEAFRFQANASGTVTKLSIVVDAANKATTIEVGLYDDGGFGHPGQALARARITATVPGWNSVRIPAVLLDAGKTYWLAVLSATPGVDVSFDEDPAAPRGYSELHQASNITSLPAWWSPGQALNNSVVICAYAATE